MKTMRKIYIYLLSVLLLAGCREDLSFAPDDAAHGDGAIVDFNIEIADQAITRGLLGDSKQSFDSGDLIHICAVFECIDKENRPRTERVYAMMQYSDEIRNDMHFNGTWSIPAGGTPLRWPDDARTASFTACYIAGSNGPLSGNAAEVKMLSSYNASEVPLFAEVKNIEYGRAVNLYMERLFAHLTLTDIQEGISNDMWFTVPEESLNNAFTLLFDPATCTMTPEFRRVPDTNYKDNNGDPLVYIKSYKRDDIGMGDEDYEAEEGTTPGLCFFLEPGEYHQFSIRYPRSGTESSVYLTYAGDLSKIKINAEGDEVGPFKRNGRYVFSILKSLGIELKETPDDGWDEREPAFEIDVEAFLKAVQSGDEYRVYDETTDQWVDILESTVEGTRLLQNISFNYKYYDVFASGFEPTLELLFDGNYHYIYHLACPLFYQNNGTITNLGIREVKTNPENPIISSENMLCGDGKIHDRSRNGIIAMHNTVYGTVDNVRVIDVDMTVKIQTSDPESPTQEAHNAALLFGSNQGLVCNVGLAGNLNLTVENADGESIIPRVMIGGAAGQNTGTIRGISDIGTSEGDDEEFAEPVVTITNNCRGANGVYMAGGIVGNNTGNLKDIFLSELYIDMSRSSGVESNLGGIVGQSPESNVAPVITGCIVRGEVKAGEVYSIVGISSHSYTGGVAGWANVQTNVDNCSASVSVAGTPNNDAEVEYGQGGAFGVLTTKAGYAEGSTHTLSCYGETLTGYHGYTGNFAGIVPGGFNWDHYTGRQINVKRHSETYVGLER